MAFLSALVIPAVLGSLTSLILYFLVSAVYSYRRLSHVPGPKLWALTRLPLIRIHVVGDSYHGFARLTEKYGKLVRVGPNHVISSNPDVIRRANAPRSPYKKSNWYLGSRLTPGVDNMVSDRNDKTHEILRKKAAPAYSGKDNPQLEQDIDGCILELMHLIDSKYITTDPANPIKMEFARKIQYLTVDIISTLSFSSKFHDLRDDNDNMGYIEEIESLFPNLFGAAVTPEIIEFLTKTGVLQLMNPSNNGKFAFGKVTAITRGKIAERFDGDMPMKDDYKDMMGSFIKHGMNRQELEQESILQLCELPYENTRVFISDNG